MASQDRQSEWDNLQDCFRLIGHVTMRWSQVDLQLNFLIANLLDVLPAKIAVLLDKQSPGVKVQIAKKLIGIDAPDGIWKDRANALFQKITRKDDGLSDRRNRYVHDIFQFNGKEISHARVKEVSTAPQPDFRLVTQAQLEAWCDDADDVLEELAWLSQALVPWLHEQREAE